MAWDFFYPSVLIKFETTLSDADLSENNGTSMHSH